MMSSDVVVVLASVVVVGSAVVVVGAVVVVVVGAAVVLEATTLGVVVDAVSASGPFSPKKRPTPIPASTMMTAATMPGSRAGCLRGPDGGAGGR
jgi:hypothetical protein